MARDPICGQAVEERTPSVLSAEYRKKRYFFCSERCRSTFRQRADRLRMHELWRAGALFSREGMVRWALA